MGHIEEKEFIDPEIFSYKRKHYVRELLSLKTLVYGTSWFEFSSFEDFRKIILEQHAFDLRQVQNIVVPVTEASQVSYLLQIKSEIRQNLVIYLKTFSQEVLGNLRVVPSVNILCDTTNIPTFKQLILGYKEPNDLPRDFLFNSQGIFKIKINRDNIDQLPYLFTDSFNVFPYFCNVLIDWDWADIEEMKIGEIQKLAYWARFLHYNVITRNMKIELNFYSGHHYFREYSLNVLSLMTGKKLFLKENTLYLENEGSPYKIDLSTLEYRDANNVDFQEINKLRMPFDIKIDESFCEFPSFISNVQNEKCTGNLAQVPYSCRVFSRILAKGDL